MKKLIVLIIALFPGVAFPEILLQSNGITVSTKDVERYVETQVPEERKSVLSSPKVMATVVENLYLTRRLAAEGEKLKLLEEENLRWDLKLSSDRLYMDAYINAKIDERIVGLNLDAMAKEEYIANKSKYIMPEKVEVSHILVKGEDQKKEIETVLAAINKGDSFEEVAIKYSQDPSVSQNKGNLGYIVRGRMVPEFDAIAFATEKGVVSKPFETKFGTHILKVTDRMKAGMKSFDEVSENIKEQLKPAIRQRFRTEIVNQIRAEKNVDLDEEAFGRFLTKNKAEYR